MAERIPSSERSSGLGRHERPASPAGAGRGAGGALFAVSGQALERVQERLESMVGKSHARCAMLIDRTGCIMASAGEFHPMSPSVMGATAAATIAALNTMVSRASSPEVTVRFYGSEVEGIHFCLVNERLVLCMLHGRGSENGDVRGAAKQVASDIGEALSSDRQRQRGESEEADLLKSVNYIESKLDQLFKDTTMGRDEG